ncbi:MAG TPA: NAD-dependent epimerase/dehydratase family protein [Patescibacteria group bacterium]|nr:NAD-dependent epimerase/dehydratase family protein [Patescibacteria group bacterium]
MKILLTGGLGFIGKNFLLHRPSDWQVFALDKTEDKNFQKKIKNAKFFKVELMDKNMVRILAKKMPNFDVCLHLAANGDPALSVADPLWDLRSTTETLINVGVNFDIKKLIYLSSGAVYDGSRGLISKRTVVNPLLPYAISHLAAENYCQYFQKSGKIKEYLIIRFFGAYGPYEPSRKIYTNLVKAFGVKKQREFIIRGNGKNLIDAMFIEDAVKGIVAAISSKKTNLTVDFCKGDHPTVNQLVQGATSVFNIKFGIKHHGQVPEYNQFYASPKEFEKLFGFRPEISFDEGLKKLEEWIRSNKE